MTLNIFYKKIGELKPFKLAHDDFTYYFKNGKLYSFLDDVDMNGDAVDFVTSVMSIEVIIETKRTISNIFELNWR